MIRLRDLPRVERLINTWCAATGGKENANKREVILIGALRRRRHLPNSIRSGIVPQGESVRSLGVPLGDFNEEQWWHTRYLVVKKRFAHFPSKEKL